MPRNRTTTRTSPTRTIPTSTSPTRTAATASAALALAVVGAAALSSISPISSPVAASATLGYAIAASPDFPSEIPPIGALTTSTTDAQAALDGARDALSDATTAMAETAESGLESRIAAPAIDTSALRVAISDLAKVDITPVLLFPDIAETADAEADAVSAQVTELRADLDAARTQKAAEDAAAQAAAQAQREAEAAAAAAQAAADALAAANTPDGAKLVAQRMAAEQYGWGADQFSCLASLWQKESGWNYQAYNASSGATGIPQALPGSKMASVGADWQTNAATQVAWGLQYIDAAYGSPCSAWGHSQSTNWY